MLTLFLGFTFNEFRETGSVILIKYSSSLSSICGWIQWKRSSRKNTFFKYAFITACAKQKCMCVYTYMYREIKKNMWHTTYIRHIPYTYIFVCTLHTYMVYTWAWIFVCRHLWHRCLERGLREVFKQRRLPAMASLGTRINVSQWPCGKPSLWWVTCKLGRKCSFL